MDWITDIIAYDGGAKELELTFQNAADKGTYIQLTLAISSNTASKAATVKTPLMNLTGLNELVVTYTNLSGESTFSGRIQATVWDADGTVKKQSKVGSTASGTLSVDISDLSGDYIIGVYGYNTSGSYEGSCRVTSIKALMEESATATAEE